MNTKPLTSHEPARYRLRLQGRLSAGWSDWLTDLRVAYEGDGQLAVTIITGTVRDQAGLFGLLSFIRDLGAPLIAVEWIPQYIIAGPKGEAMTRTNKDDTF